MENEWWYKKEVMNSLMEIMPKDYAINAGADLCVSFDKTDEKRSLSISLGKILDHSFSNIQSFIAFYEIENILHPKFEKSRKTDDAISIRTYNQELIFNQEQGKYIYENLPIELSSLEAIKKSTELVVKFIQEYSNPFFDYWTDIRCFLPFIESEDIVYVANDVFAGYGMKKKMIIWKLCNHPKYNQFVEERKDVYDKLIKENPSDLTLQKEYKELLSFLKKLEKVTPKYKWDKKYLELQKGNPVFPEE